MFIFSYDEGSRDGKSQAAFCLFGPSSLACDFHPHAYHMQKKNFFFFLFIGRERHQSQLDNLLSCGKSTDPITSASIRKTFHCPAGLLCSLPVCSHPVDQHCFTSYLYSVLSPVLGIQTDKIRVYQVQASWVACFLPCPLFFFFTSDAFFLFYFGLIKYYFSLLDFLSNFRFAKELSFYREFPYNLSTFSVQFSSVA